MQWDRGSLKTILDSKRERGEKKYENRFILGQGIHDIASKSWVKSTEIVLSGFTSFLAGFNDLYCYLF